jgi:tetratricopeptide (TPR) repeat protein
VFGLFSGNFHAAADLLGSLDAERELDWLTDPAKLIYWRDYVGAEHYTGDYDAELRHAQRPVEAYPDRGIARYFLARALSALGRGDEALGHVDAALRLPTDVSARVETGVPPTFTALLGRDGVAGAWRHGERASRGRARGGVVPGPAARRRERQVGPLLPRAPAGVPRPV